MPVIDVVIPTYRPDARLLRLLEALRKQTQPVRQIIIMHTGPEPLHAGGVCREEMTDRFDLRVYQVAKRDFDHGGTRRRGIEKSDAPYVLLMTQDALPADGELTKSLLRPLRLRSAKSCSAP